MNERLKELTLRQRVLKRTMDVAGAILGLLLTGWIIIPAFAAASIDTKANGFFTQKRIGKNRKIFRVVKIRTMRPIKGLDTTVTTGQDSRITPLGSFFRGTKFDELPQLFNVLFGHMSLVGPRPDVPGFADKLQGADSIIVNLRPGITGPATLNFRDEEILLTQVEDPEQYNREVIFPEKVRLNKEYIEKYSFWSDIRYILKTIISR